MADAFLPSPPAEARPDALHAGEGSVVRGRAARRGSAKLAPAARWKHYGQDDHLRLYGRRDFVRRLEEAGFKVQQLGVEHFGRERFRRAGIHENSVLYVAEKSFELRR